jgi:cobalt-zinc-cadmium efflux system outer membrane protein
MKNTTLYEVSNSLVKAQTAQRLVELYRTSVLPQVRQSLRVTEAGYRGGKTEFIDLLDATRSYLSFHLAYYEYIADYEIALADLERTVGTDLQEVQP